MYALEVRGRKVNRIDTLHGVNGLWILGFDAFRVILGLKSTLTYGKLKYQEHLSPVSSWK